MPDGRVTRRLRVLADAPPPFAKASRDRRSGKPRPRAPVPAAFQNRSGSALLGRERWAGCRKIFRKCQAACLLAAYAGWEQVQDYVVQRLRQAASTNSPSAALYINLVSNALNVIQNGEYLPPSRRPGWDRSVKPQRLTFSKNIPGFAANDYAVVVSLLCNADTSTRRAAQRLMKLYPSNSFYAPLQKLSKPGNDANCDSEFIAELAVNYFYNRIVEYDGSFPLDASK